MKQMKPPRRKYQNDVTQAIKYTFNKYGLYRASFISQ